MFRIATHVYGVAHPDFIPHALSPEQLAEAMAFHQLEPWGPERDHYHAALIALACAQPFSKKRLHLKDFLLKFGKPDRPKGLADKLRLVAAGVGARFKKKEKKQ